MLAMKNSMLLCARSLLLVFEFSHCPVLCSHQQVEVLQAGSQGGAVRDEAPGAERHREGVAEAVEGHVSGEGGGAAAGRERVQVWNLRDYGLGFSRTVAPDSGSRRAHGLRL